MRALPRGSSSQFGSLRRPAQLAQLAHGDLTLRFQLAQWGVPFDLKMFGRRVLQVGTKMGNLILKYEPLAFGLVGDPLVERFVPGDRGN